MKERIRALVENAMQRLIPLVQLPYQVRVMRTDLVEDSALDIIQEEQLGKGLDSEDESLGTYASLAYKGRYQPVDLYDTGSFYRKMYASVTAGGTFYTSSTDSKNQKLERKYGKDIHGVSRSNFAEWFPDIRLAYAAEIRKDLR